MSRSEPERARSRKDVKFDPIKNMHLWVMWRTAVNEQIIKETRKKKKPDHLDVTVNKVFTKVPLAKYIRLAPTVNGKSPYVGPHRERQWYNEDGLQTRQLVYFGVPRPKLNQSRLHTGR